MKFKAGDRVKVIATSGGGVTPIGDGERFMGLVTTVAKDTAPEGAYFLDHPSTIGSVHRFYFGGTWLSPLKKYRITLE
jgi:hypothetical protein